MILERLIKVISDYLDIEKSKITEDTSLTNELNASFMDILNIILLVENEFNIEIDINNIEKLTDVKNIVKCIEKLTY